MFKLNACGVIRDDVDASWVFEFPAKSPNEAMEE